MNAFGSKTELIEAIISNAGVLPGEEAEPTAETSDAVPSAEPSNSSESVDTTEKARSHSIITKRLVCDCNMLANGTSSHRS